MTRDDDLRRKAADIGARIDALVKADPRGQAGVAAELEVEIEALKKVQAGKSNRQYAKLARVAAVLRTTPNHLLGFDGGTERELLRGAIEGAYTGLGFPAAEAREFAEVFLRLIDRCEADNLDPPSADRGRILADYLVREFVDLKRR